MIFISKGTFWSKKSGSRDGRKGYNTLEEALEDAQPTCCGIDCKCNVIRLKDRGTGELVSIGVVNGVLSILNNETLAVQSTITGIQGLTGAQGIQGIQGITG